MSVVVGIDGGATKTACVILPSDAVAGEAAGQGLASSSNKNSVGKDKAEAAVAEAVDQALSQAGKARSDVSCIVIGMSGCDTAEDVSYWKQVCSKMLPGAKAVVENDAVVALCSGTGGELQGIIVIAGTGSIGMAVDGDERVRVGGMGPVLGDAGNAYSIGCAALAAVVKGADGRGPETTALTGRMMEALGISDIQEGLLGWAYGGESAAAAGGWDRIANLAPLVSASALQDDCPVCKDILAQAGHEIVNLASAAAQRSGMSASSDGYALVLTGSVNMDETVCKAVNDEAAKRLPGARLVRPEGVSPAMAAALMACKVAAKGGKGE